MSSGKAKNNWKISEFVGHSSAINCLALSPDNGRLLATGGDDRKINLWSPGKPNNILSISGMTSPVQSVTFNNSENWIGSGSKSGVIKVFDIEGRKSVRTITGHKSGVSSLDFHRYGEILATGSSDTNLKIWDVRRKGCIFTYKGHTDSIDSVQFSPDGKWVTTASSDSTVKIWDLSAGRMVADFRAHTAAVTSLRFHPKLFLMATGSVDRTVKFWDLEKFEVVSEVPAEANAIRQVLFHRDGSFLFTGTQDSLKVHSWEPVETLDVVPIHWGRVSDMVMSGDQLIAASFAQTNVSIWCVELDSLRAFQTPPEPPTQPDKRPLTESGRKRFEFNEMTHSRAAHTPPGGDINSEEGGESPTLEVKADERKQIFQQCQKLIMTPPKENRPPFRAPGSPKKLKPSDHIPSQLSAQGLDNGGHTRDPHPPKAVQVGKSPESRLITEITNNHSDAIQLLSTRLAILKSSREVWSPSEPKVSLERAINSGSQPALVDLLNLLKLKRTLWNLDMAMMVLPELKLLLRSKYKEFVLCGCHVVKLILNSFGPVIKANLKLPPSSGVDLTREERYERCYTCHSHLIGLREDVYQLSADSRMGRAVRDAGILNSFTVLD